MRGILNMHQMLQLFGGAALGTLIPCRGANLFIGIAQEVRYGNHCFRC